MSRFRLVSNFSGRARRRKLAGKEYLVAPVSIIVPGVLPGSEGPLMYEGKDIESSTSAWNELPILLEHPNPEFGKENGTGQKAKVILSQGIGFISKPRYQNKLKTEAWFDIERTNQLAPGLASRIESGEKIELSTGLGADLERKTGEFNGRSYVGVVRNYQPDHLAILLRGPGACSIRDGCGVNVDNEKSKKSSRTKTKSYGGNNMPTTKKPKKMTDSQRKKIIDNMITNCDCWSEEDRELLENSDDRVLNLYQNESENTKKVVTLENKLKELEEELEVFNSESDDPEEDETSEDSAEEAPKKIKKAKKATVTNKVTTPKLPPKDVSIEDYMKDPSVPRQVRELVQNSLDRIEEEKSELIETIKANPRNKFDDEALQAIAEREDGFTLLKNMASLAATEEEERHVRIPSYLGSAIANHGGEKLEPAGGSLGIPVYNEDYWKN